MSLSAKQLKEMEKKVSDSLHGNIKLLTHLYPTSKEFNSVFKQGMFQKSNKAAFQHIIYYLFTILDPELTTKKIKSWPLYDAKLEGVFRTEVVNFINCINSKYENANLPSLIASQLVTPGGLKFSQFMLKLSNLVIHEHLKKKEELKPELLNPIKPCKNPVATNLMLKTLKLKTASVEQKVIEKQKNFHATHKKLSNEAQTIISEQTRLESDLATTRDILKEKKSKSCPESAQVLTDRLDSLKPRMEQMQRIKSLCEEGSNLLEYLSSKKPVVQFKKDEFRIPDSVKHLFNINNENDELDLCELFASLAVLLDSEDLELPTLAYDVLLPLSNIVSELNEKCAQLDEKLDSHLSDLAQSSEAFDQYLRGSEDPKTSKESSESFNNVILYSTL